MTGAMHILGRTHGKTRRAQLERLQHMACGCPTCRLVVTQPEAWSFDIIDKQPYESERTRTFVAGRSQHLLIHALRRWVLGVSDSYAMRSTIRTSWLGVHLTAEVRTICPSHFAASAVRMLDLVVENSELLK